MDGGVKLLCVFLTNCTVFTGHAAAAAPSPFQTAPFFGSGQQMLMCFVRGAQFACVLAEIHTLPLRGPFFLVNASLWVLVVNCAVALKTCYRDLNRPASCPSVTRYLDQRCVGGVGCNGKGMLLFVAQSIANNLAHWQWAVGSGQWAVGSGQWAVGSGRLGTSVLPRRGQTVSAITKKCLQLI